jgi:hypothetical protein
MATNIARMPVILQTGELSENSLISEICVSTSDKDRQLFLLSESLFSSSD